MSSNGAEPVTGEGEAAQGLAPKLRFPEFLDAGDWNRRSLGPHLIEHAGRVGANTDVPVYSSSRVGLTPQGEYFDGSNLQNFGEYSEVPNGYITYRHMSDDGVFKFNMNQTGRSIAVSKEYPVFTTLGISSSFLLNILNDSYDFTRFALSQKKGGTRTRLYLSALRTWDPLLPPKEPEQQKIADCLSSLDAVIAVESERLAALREYKKGLIQQLFPRPERVENGEKIPAEKSPRLRFPEFKDAGEWERASLGPITLKVGSGITPKGGQAIYKKVGRPFMRSQNVGWGELRLEDIAFIDERTHSGFAATEIQADDVLLNITGASIGRSAIADQRIVGGNVSQHVCIIRVDRRALTPGYLNQFLLGQEGQSQIDSFQAGGNRQGLNFDQIRSFQIPTPPELDEQERVADCLSSIDSLLFSADRRISELKALRSGLMQQLFPSPAAAYI